MTLPSASKLQLRTVIETDLGPPPGRRGCRGNRPWWNCPFHDDPHPSLTVTPNGLRWKCFGCGARGDAIDWIRRRNLGTSFQEAKKLLGLGPEPKGRPLARSSSSKPSQEKPSASKSSKSRSQRDKPMEPEKWQSAAKKIVQVCEANLWSPNGEKARAWLKDRGLHDETIRRFHLGFNPDKGTIAGLWVARGIVIPWLDGATVRRLKIRRAKGNPKYLNVGGAPGHGLYAGSTLHPGIPALVLEGEFDTLLAIQELDDLVTPVTYGSASDKPFPAELRPLFVAPLVLLASDADSAGDENADHFLDLLRRARRLRPCDGNDLTEMWRSGVEIGRWVSNALREAGWNISMTEEERELFEERAAILEYEGCFRREEAEAQARAAIPRMVRTMGEIASSNCHGRGEHP